MRDARITTIYEGTTGIQAADLVGRKLAMDKGAAMMSLIGDMSAVVEQLGNAQGDDMAAIKASLAQGVKDLTGATQWLAGAMANPSDVMAVSVSYLMLVGYVVGGWQMARAALVAQDKLSAGEDPSFYEAKLVTARFYAEHILPKATALAADVRAGGASIMALTEDQF